MPLRRAWQCPNQPHAGWQSTRAPETVVRNAWRQEGAFAPPQNRTLGATWVCDARARGERKRG
eukprot:5144602-Prymnesium_polylepis.1